jgi:predicted transglutaminase-like cysteine proteinase
MRLCLIALALSCVALPALAAESIPRTTAQSFPVPQASVMAREHGPVDTCAALQDAYVAGGWPRGAGVETLKQIDSRVKQRMHLKNDAGVDTWTPLSAAILSGKRPSGDCDDLSVTTAQFAICAGMPADRLGLLITESPNRGSAELHMLAFYSDPSDRTWVFGDTFGRPRALSKVNQRLLFFARMDQVTRWYALTDRNGDPLTSAVPDATSAIPLLPETPRYGSCSGRWSQGGD